MLIYIHVQHTPAMSIYKFGGLVDPGKYRNNPLNAQSPYVTTIFRVNDFQNIFDPGYNLLKVDIYSCFAHSCEIQENIEILCRMANLH